MDTKAKWQPLRTFSEMSLGVSFTENKSLVQGLEKKRLAQPQGRLRQSWGLKYYSLKRVLLGSRVDSFLS